MRVRRSYGSWNYSTVSIVNDTTNVVVVSDCVGNECTSEDLPLRVAPAGHYDNQAACGATGSNMTSWRLLNPRGQLIGYIAVDSPRKRDGLVFNVSAASPNRSTPTPPR